MSATTTLSASVAAGDTTITVADGSDFAQPLLIQIDRETLIVNDGPPGNTWTVIRDQAAGGSEVLDADQFDDRTVADAWGGAWKHASSSALGSFNVASGVATHQFLGVTGVPAPVYLSADIYQDSEVRVRFMGNVMPSGGDSEVSLFIRDLNTSPNNRYLARCQISTLGVVTTRLRKIIGGTGTSLGSNVTASGTFAAGDWWWIAVQATGVNPTSLKMKAWRELDGEPGAWTQSLTDSDATLQVAGYGGIRAQVDALNVNLPTWSFDQFSIGSIALGGYTHSSGAIVVAVDNSWPGPVSVVVRGAPTFPAPSGSLALDIDGDKLYVRVGSTWKGTALT